MPGWLVGHFLRFYLGKLGSWKGVLQLRAFCAGLRWMGDAVGLRVRGRRWGGVRYAIVLGWW